MLFYCQDAQGNFGDDLNPWLWPRLLPELCRESEPALFLGIGTILNFNVPLAPRKAVLGAGVGYYPPPTLDARWRIYGVRGPLSAQAMGLDPQLAITDGALLVRTQPLPDLPRRYQVSFMPHCRSAQQAEWGSLCARVGLHYIDPRSGVDQVLAELRQTELLLAEAMHGAIVADALRVPWIPVRLYSQVLEFKWRDWAASLELSLSMTSIPPIFEQPLSFGDTLLHACKRGLAAAGLGKDKWNRLQVRMSSPRSIETSLRLLARLPSETKPFLSADAVVARAEERLLEALERLRKDYRDGVFRPAVAGQAGPQGTP